MSQNKLQFYEILLPPRKMRRATTDDLGIGLLVVTKGEWFLRIANY